MTQPPTFEDAVVWVIFPEHLTDDEILRAKSALEAALPESAPVISAVARETGTRSFLDKIPGKAVYDLGVLIAKEAVKGATTLIRDEYRADQAAMKSYDQRAERYNQGMDRYFGRK